MSNPKSLDNLKPGANRKLAIRVNLTLKPQTVQLLKMQGNMSEDVDKLVHLCTVGAVSHDGCLNPVQVQNPIAQTDTTATELMEINEPTVNTESEAPAITNTDKHHAKPDYWERCYTKAQILTARIATAHQLTKLKDGDSFLALDGWRYWKVAINQHNTGLLPLGSRATYLFCRGTIVEILEENK